MLQHWFSKLATIKKNYSTVSMKFRSGVTTSYKKHRNHIMRARELQYRMCFLVRTGCWRVKFKPLNFRQT